VRVECARDLPGCQSYINDTICGDLVGHARTWSSLLEVANRFKAYTENHAIVPWFEMVWGEGSDNPSAALEWYAGCLEYIAMSINFEMKIEHSFQPFDYPNVRQIRALTNLYGPRQRQYKVLCAGRKAVTIPDLQAAGLKIDHTTRFLAAPENDITVTLRTAMLGTNALQWRGRSVFSGAPVRLRARNEFWGGSLLACFVEFEAEGGQVYELWHEGAPDAYFADLIRRYGVLTNGGVGPKPD